MINSRFISFEGGEGSGKSTQIKLLAKKLSKKRKVIITREPGGTKDAEKIRNLVVKDKNQKWSGTVETILLFAARKDHVDKVIMPNLKKGYWVLCDRYIDSTIAYQGHGKKVDLKIINSLNKTLIKNLVPSITFLLDIDPKTGLARSKRKGNNDLRYENMHINFHRKVRSSFLKIAKINKNRIKVIDASQKKVEISDIIWEMIKRAKRI